MRTQITTVEFRILFDEAYAHHTLGEYEAEQAIREQLDNCRVVFDPEAYADAYQPERLLEADLLLEPPMDADQFYVAWSWVDNHGFNRLNNF